MILLALHIFDYPIFLRQQIQEKFPGIYFSRRLQPFPIFDPFLIPEDQFKEMDIPTRPRVHEFGVSLASPGRKLRKPNGFMF